MTSLPDGAEFHPAVEATWPPSSASRLGPWTIRKGPGGKRVSAATAEAPFRPEDVARAERAMERIGQQPLFMIRDGDADLDAALAAAGYGIVDPTLLYAIPASALADRPLPPASAFRIWPPLAIMRELWAAGGIGPDRLGVMDRAAEPRTALLARMDDRAAGCAFVACRGDCAMIHAIEVAPPMRRKGVASNLLRSAAFWAQDRGAACLALAVTRANGAARSLYASLGLAVVGQYHYRARPRSARMRRRIRQ